MGRPAAVLLTNSWIPTYWIMFILFNLPNSPVLQVLSPASYRSVPAVSLALGVAISVIDGISRTFAIAGTIEGIRNSPYPHIHVMKDSWVALLILGGIAAMGGGLIDGLIGLRKREWSLRTPSFLINDREGWAFRWCAVCAALYIVLTDVTLSQYVASIFDAFHLAPLSHLVAPKLVFVKDSNKLVSPYLPAEAKTLICSLLIGAIAWRNVFEDIIAPPVAQVSNAPKGSVSSNSPSKKTK
jgi:hypothetical protein